MHRLSHVHEHQVRKATAFQVTEFCWRSVRGLHCRKRGEFKALLDLCASSRLKIYLFVHGFTVDTGINGAESGLSLFRQVNYIKLDWTTPHFLRETYRDRSTSYFVHTFTLSRWQLQCTPKRRKEHAAQLNCEEKVHIGHIPPLKKKNWRASTSSMCERSFVPCFEVLTTFAVKGHHY
jgi:hypothetical protein